MDSSFLGIKRVLLAIVNKGQVDSSDFTIADYLLKHYDSIDQININEMAASCFVDRSTIRRFFAKNGYQNFADFKKHYERESGKEEMSPVYCNYNDYILHLNQSLNDFIHRFAVKRDKTEDVDRFNRYINECERLFLMGDDSVAGTLYLIQETLISAGKAVYIVDDPAVNPIVNTIKEKDCILLCSLTGRYYHSVQKSLEKMMCRKLLITIKTENKWKESFDYILQMTGENVQQDIYRHYGLMYFADIMMTAYKMKYWKDGA